MQIRADTTADLVLVTLRNYFSYTMESENNQVLMWKMKISVFLLYYFAKEYSFVPTFFVEEWYWGFIHKECNINENAAALADRMIYLGNLSGEYLNPRKWNSMIDIPIRHIFMHGIRSFQVK